MKILEKYLLKEYLKYWYGITSILTLVLVSDTLATILSKAIQGTIDSQVILPLFITNVFQFSLSLIPLGLFLGIMVGMGRLYHESEMASSYACGLSPMRMIKPALVAGFMGVVIVSILAFWVSPWAANIEQNIIAKEKAKQEIDKVEAGRFNVSKNNKTVIFVQNKTDEGLKSVFVESTDEQGQTGAEVSESASVKLLFDEQLPYFVFKNGSTYKHNNETTNKNEEGDISITYYQEHGVLLENKVYKKASQKMAAVPTLKLIKSKGLREQAELHWRIGVPISTLLLALLALPLSHSAPRKGRYSKMVLAIFLYIVYVNVLIFARKSIENGTIPVEYGMWWVHVLSFSIVAILLFKRQRFG